MKTLSYSVVVFALMILYACSSDTQKQSEIIQHNEPVLTALDGPATKVVLKKGIDLETENPAEKYLVETQKMPTPKRIVNQSPNKTMETLLVEVTQIEEQGATEENAAKVYNAYGDSLVEQGLYTEALETYKVAEENNYEDMKDLYFKLARTYALNHDYDGIEDYLTKAEEAGFRNYRALLYDAAFEEWRSEYGFMDFYNELFGHKKKAMFKAFVHLAPKTNLKKDVVVDPVTLYENVDYDYRKKNDFYDMKPYISGYFEDFVEGISEGMFSREGGDDYRYEMMLTKNKNYVAVVYSKEEEWSEFLLPKVYTLVTYDRKGNKISELELAKRGSLKKGKGFVFHPDNSFEITEYKVEWKSGAKKRFEKEEIYMTHKDLKTVVAQTTQTYRIAATGKIVETNGVALSMK